MKGLTVSVFFIFVGPFVLMLIHLHNVLKQLKEISLGSLLP